MEGNLLEFIGFISCIISAIGILVWIIWISASVKQLNRIHKKEIEIDDNQ